MKNRSLPPHAALAALVLALAPVAVFGSDPNHPGYVDFDNLAVAGDLEAQVDIRIGGWLMDIARDATRDDEDMRILSNIQSIRVRVFEVGAHAADFRAQAQEVLAELRHTGWEEFARVHGRDELVYILVKGDRDRLHGITILAVDSADEAVFVNIAGTIDPADVARLVNDEDLIHAHIDIDV